ncbi:hypothetical protein V2J09_021123 [Rumex salicifolius]
MPIVFQREPATAMSIEIPSPAASYSDGLDDVEAHEGDPSMSPERFHQLFERSVRESGVCDNKYEEAIKCYSTANSLKPGDPTILSNRSAAYIRYKAFDEYDRENRCWLESGGTF